MNNTKAEVSKRFRRIKTWGDRHVADRDKMLEVWRQNDFWQIGLVAECVVKKMQRAGIFSPNTDWNDVSVKRIVQAFSLGSRS